MLGGVVFLFHLGDLLQQILIFGFQFILQSLNLLPLGDQLSNNAVSLFPLGVQLGLGRVEFFLGLLQIRLFRCQLFLRCGYGLCSLVQSLQTAVIRGGDLFNHTHSVQQVREAVGLEEDLPIAQGSLFLHGADSGFVFFVQIVVVFLCCVQFVLLVRNQNTVGGDLLVDIVYLGMQQTDLLINQVFSGYDIRNFVFIGLVLILQFFHLALHFRPLLLQAVDLLADLAGGGGIGLCGHQTENQRQYHDRSHNGCQNGNKFLTIFHKASFGYHPMYAVGPAQASARNTPKRRLVCTPKVIWNQTSMNFRIEVQLPTMPTNRPAAANTRIMGTSSVSKGTKVKSFRASTVEIFSTRAS